MYWHDGGWGAAWMMAAMLVFWAVVIVSVVLMLWGGAVAGTAT